MGELLPQRENNNQQISETNLNLRRDKKFCFVETLEEDLKSYWMFGIRGTRTSKGRCLIL